MSLSEVVEGGGLFLYAPLIIAFPILGMLINLMIGRRLGERFVGVVASSAIGLAFVVALTQFLALRTQPHGVSVPVVDWIVIGELQVSWSLKVDTLSTTMMLMVSGVSTLIHIYAIGYMHDDVRFQGDLGRYTRFFVYFNLFVAAMMVLVTADNFLMMFVGWEGVGLCSYLLIGFWYEKGEDGIGNAIAGKKAFITNRIGDLGFLIAMFMIFGAVGSLQFDEVFLWAHEHGLAHEGIVTAITLFLLLGATGKSAQLPLYVWLPDAMAGPTPVSALIHAATMVTAGIYMIARNQALFAVSEFSSGLVAIVGAATALFAATIAVGQFDIKRVLAYSTISQLGFMLAAVGIGAQVAGMFHLLTHAFFKALLFLSAGSVILGIEHGHHHLARAAHGNPGGEEHFDPNDMRNMGGLRSRMKITYWVYLIGALALAGLPPLAGFFSKDEILADAFAENMVVYVLLAIAAFFTAFYMGRQILMVFFGEPRSDAAEHAPENPPVITVPLILLAVGAILGGLLNFPGVHTLTDWLEHTLHVHVSDFNLQVAATSTGLALLAIALSWRLYGRAPMEEGQPDPLRKLLGPIFVGMENKWWVDEIYDFLIVRPYVALAAFLADVVDWRFWHDWFHDSVLARAFREGTRWLNDAFDLRVIDGAANGLGDLTKGVAARLRLLQTGYVRNYALAVLVGVLLILSYFLFA
ncbi:MAG: NADH-quinone oxidoreductase subunit L [Anaerolineales bacterium]|nr:NADH-quinone oxidoreductase subunit L [Anaerolineales bacterium]